jgi:hypothetical protein
MFHFLEEKSSFLCVVWHTTREFSVQQPMGMRFFKQLLWEGGANNLFFKKQ